MARNSEKAQSMLYRFREQQAIDMGIGTRQKGDRRPRMASSCTSLREAERWRGDILRDINRKVSKIQDGEMFLLSRLVWDAVLVDLILTLLTTSCFNGLSSA